MTTASRQKPPKIPPFAPDFVKGVCDVLAQTAFPGLSGSEIDSLLQMVRVEEREPGGNKRESLYITLYNVQVRQQAGNVVGGFIAKAMSPSRYAAQPGRFNDLRDQLNEFLVYYGYSVTEAGKLMAGTKASTISEGAARAGRLRTELVRRGCHAELLRYCDEELINRSLFHAMSEASKSIPARIRSITGLAGDGLRCSTGCSVQIVSIPFGRSTITDRTPRLASIVDSRTCWWASTGTSGIRGLTQAELLSMRIWSTSMTPSRCSPMYIVGSTP